MSRRCTSTIAISRSFDRSRAPCRRSQPPITPGRAERAGEGVVGDDRQDRSRFLTSKPPAGRSRSVIGRHQLDAFGLRFSAVERPPFNNIARSASTGAVETDPRRRRMRLDV